MRSEHGNDGGRRRLCGCRWRTSPHIPVLGRQAVEFVDLELERCAVTQRKQHLLFDEAMYLVGGDAEAKSSFPSGVA